VRGEAIKLVDGGTQKRAFTYIDDGINALIKIIANDGGIASGKIYNIGNPDNNYSVRDLARMMLDLALTYSGVQGDRRESAVDRDDRPTPTTERVTRTSRIGCRRSTTPAQSLAGSRWWRWTNRCGESSTPTAARLPKRVRWWSK